MKPTVIYLPEETELALKAIASQNGKTPSEIVQEMTNQYLRNKKNRLCQALELLLVVWRLNNTQPLTS